MVVDIAIFSLDFIVIEAVGDYLAEVVGDCDRGYWLLVSGCWGRVRERAAILAHRTILSHRCTRHHLLLHRLNHLEIAL